MPAELAYKCLDCGGTRIAIDMPKNPWDERPDEFCFHQAPNKPAGVVGFIHPKSEPCELRALAEAMDDHVAMCGFPRENCPKCRTFASTPSPTKPES